MSTTTLVHKQPSRTLVVAAFAAIYTIWGSTYLAILLALKHIPTFFLAGSRFLIAGLILYVWCRIRGEETPQSASITKISFSGILMLLIGTGAVVWVEQYLPTGIAAIIVATLPLWFVVLDKREWKHYFSNKWIIIGLLVGFAGVMLLFGDRSGFSFRNDRMKLISFFVMLGGTISWAIGSLYSKYKHTDGSTTMKASIQMMAAGAVALLIGFITGEHYKFSLSEVSMNSFTALVYLIIMGSLVGYMAYVWLLSVKPPSLVGTYAYVNPVVAVFLGWLIADEQISRQQIIALVVILLGVVLVNFTKDKTKKL
jgi:drug/metabolite transporter (DMT)-like permease